MEFGEQESLNFLQELFSRKCDVVVAGPLLKTNCETEFLLKLEEDFLKGISKGIPIESKRSATNYGVRVRKILGIKCIPSEGDTLCIEVRQNVTKEWQKGTGTLPAALNSKVLLLAMLSSCGSSGHELRRVCRAPNTHLPLCIYRGYSKVWDVIRKVIYKVLNCSFVTPKLSESNVKVVSGLWILERMKCDKLQRTKVKYIMKPQTGGSTEQAVEIQFHLGRWMDIWKTTSQDPNTLISAGLIGRLTRNWTEMVTEIVSLSDTVDQTELNGVALDEVLMSTFYFSKRGKVRIKVDSKSSCLPILAYLTAIFTGNEKLDVLLPVESEPEPKSRKNRKNMVVETEPDQVLPKNRKRKAVGSKVAKKFRSNESESSSDSTATTKLPVTNRRK